MAQVTFQVLDGVDKGRMFRNLSTPVTIGREEGNVIRLNDERVSRYHAKVQQDDGDVILTDLESTNGTRVNGHVVQIRRLRAGDRVCLGRSLLLFGSNEEIAARMVTLTRRQSPAASGTQDILSATQGQATIPGQMLAPDNDQDLEFDLNLENEGNGELTITDSALFVGQHALPPLPQKLAPAQAARLAEILDFLHRGITSATDNMKANDEGTQVTLGFHDWQRVLAVQMLLSRYLRAIVEPDALSE